MKAYQDFLSLPIQDIFLGCRLLVISKAIINKINFICLPSFSCFGLFEVFEQTSCKLFAVLPTPTQWAKSNGIRFGVSIPSEHYRTLSNLVVNLIGVLHIFNEGFLLAYTFHLLNWFRLLLSHATKERVITLLYIEVISPQFCSFYQS